MGLIRLITRFFFQKHLVHIYTVGVGGSQNILVYKQKRNELFLVTAFLKVFAFRLWFK